MPWLDFDDELNLIAAAVGSRKKVFQLAKRDHKFAIPSQNRQTP